MGTKTLRAFANLPSKGYLVVVWRLRRQDDVSQPTDGVRPCRSFTKLLLLETSSIAEAVVVDDDETTISDSFDDVVVGLKVVEPTSACFLLESERHHFRTSTKKDGVIRGLAQDIEQSGIYRNPGPVMGRQQNGLAVGLNRQCPYVLLTVPGVEHAIRS